MNIIRTPELEHQMMMLYNLGYNTREICEALGISWGVVRHWRNQNNLPPNKGYFRRGHRDPRAASMESALNERECEVIQTFISDLRKFNKLVRREIKDSSKLTRGQISQYMAIWRAENSEWAKKSTGGAAA